MNPKRKLDRVLSIYILLFIIIFAVPISYLIVQGKKHSIIVDSQKLLNFSQKNIAGNYQERLSEYFNMAKAFNKSLSIRLSESNDPPNSIFKESEITIREDGTLRSSNHGSGAFYGHGDRIDRKIKRFFFFSERVFQLFDPIYKNLFYNFYFISKEGFIRISPPKWALEIEKDHDFNNDVFYNIATPDKNPQRKPVWTDIYYDSIWDKWVVSIIHPLYINNEFIGVTGNDLVIDDFWDEISALKKETDLYSAFLIDKNNNLLTHSAFQGMFESSKLSMNTIFIPDKPHEQYLKYMIKKMGENKNISNNDEYLGKDDRYFFSYSSELSNGWRLCVYTQESVILENFNSIVRSIIYIALILSIMLFIIIRIFFQHFILIRIKNLGKSITEIGAGNLDYSVSIQKEDEIGQLEEGLIVLKDSLKKKDADIEEQRRELKQSQQKYKSYIDNSPYGVFIANSKGNYLEVNQKACEITGYSEKELLKMSIPDLIHKRYLEAAGKHFHNVIDKGFASGEYGYITKNGEERFWQVDSVKLDDDRLIGFSIDITELRKNQIIIKTLKERLELSLKVNHSTVFVENFITGTMECTPELFLALGYSHNEIPNTIEGFTKLMHPDDVDVKLNAVNDYFNGKKRKYFIEFRLCTKSGEWKWVDGQGAVIKRDAQGNPVELLVVSRLIDERKKITEELKRYKDHLEELVRIRTEELEAKNAELENFNRLFTGREFRIKELKKTIDRLRKKIDSESD